MQDPIKIFQKKVWDFYALNRRSFAWRENISPYHVFISEVMLQQTQTARVSIKFDQWIQIFPDFATLAAATAHQVLHAWQGLGYNRRGLWLHASAKKIMADFGGQLPADPQALQKFPGIGPNTAASICAFAFNMPVVFIETNIRTVFLHEFFLGQKDVSDQQLTVLIQESLDPFKSRDWYYALMDYGVHLKKDFKASNRSSKHYAKQSRFVGSKREMRGAIVRILTRVGRISTDELSELVRFELPLNVHDPESVLQGLIEDEMVQRFEEEVFL